MKIENIISEQTLKKLISTSSQCLTERQRKILLMRYNPDTQRQETLEQIGQQIGITRERVRQIINHCIRKMQNSRTNPQDLKASLA